MGNKLLLRSMRACLGFFILFFATALRGDVFSVGPEGGWSHFAPFTGLTHGRQIDMLPGMRTQFLALGLYGGDGGEDRDFEEEDSTMPLILLNWVKDVEPRLQQIFRGEILADPLWVLDIEERLQQGLIEAVPEDVIQQFMQWPVLAICFRGDDGRTLLEALADLHYNPLMTVNLGHALGYTESRELQAIALLLRTEDLAQRFRLAYEPSARMPYLNRPPLFPLIWTGNLKLLQAFFWAIKDTMWHGIYGTCFILRCREPFIREGAGWKAVTVWELLAALKESDAEGESIAPGARYDKIEAYLRQLNEQHQLHNLMD